MALQTCVGSFNTGTGAVGTTIDVSCVNAANASGFQPKAVFFWLSGRTETVDTVGSGHHKFGVGAATSDTDRRCAVTQSADNTTTMFADRYHSNVAAVATITSVATGAMEGLLDVAPKATWPANGFRMVVDDAFPVSYRVHFLAFGGDDLTNAETFQFAQPTAANSAYDVTTLSFQPDCVILFGVDHLAIPGVATASHFTLGVATGGGAAEQAVLHGASNDALATSNTLSYCCTGECFARATTSNNTLTTRASLTQFLANGARFNFSLSGPNATLIHGLALKGGQYKLGTLTTLAALSTDIVASGIGFTPRAGLLASHTKVFSTAGTTQDSDDRSLGAFAAVGEQVACAILDEDNAAISEVQTAVEHDSVYINLDPTVAATAGGIEGRAAVTAIGSDDFTLRMTDGDPDGRDLWYLAFGDAAAAAGTPYTVSLGGGVAFGGSLSRGAGKGLGGSAVPAGVLTRQAAREMGGGVVPAGAVSRRTGKSLAGAVTPTGAMAAARVVLLALLGGVSAAGSLARRVGKSLAGAVTPAGARSNRTAKSYSGSAVPTGSRTGRTDKSLSGSAAPAGTLARAASKAWAAGVATAGVLTKRGQIALAGAVTPSGSFARLKVVLLAMAGAVAVAGGLARRTAKPLTGSAAAAGSRALRTAKGFAGSAATSGAFSKLRVVLLALAGSVTAAGSLARRTTKAFAAASLTAGAMTRKTSKSMAGSAATSATLVRASLLSMAGSVTVAGGAVAKAVYKLLAGAASATGSFAKSVPGSVGAGAAWFYKTFVLGRRFK